MHNAVKKIEEKAEQGTKKLTRSADKIEKISQQHLKITLWVTISIAVIATLINVILFVIRGKEGC